MKLSEKILAERQANAPESRGAWVITTKEIDEWRWLAVRLEQQNERLLAALMDARSWVNGWRAATEEAGRFGPRTSESEPIAIS